MQRLNRFIRRTGVATAILGVAAAWPARPLTAQVPQIPPGQQLPTPDQARELIKNQPQIVNQLRQRLLQSGLTPDQVRSRLRAAGYPENLLDDYLTGADTTRQVRPGARTIEAVSALGILSDAEADSLQVQDSMLVLSDSLRFLLDSLRAMKADSARADSLSDSVRVLQGQGLKIFGIETFRRASTRFQPTQSGPVDANYRLGSGDLLVLILTGDVEQAYSLDVNREGFIVIPQVGQVHVANLTLTQLKEVLYSRLGRVYSGVRRGPNARTRFEITVGRLRNIQVFVVGDVVRPGAYQMSAAGTALGALYAAGGPTANGSFRQVEVRRGGKLVDSLDIYDYLLQGINRSDLRLDNGDVVFVPVHGGFAKLGGEVTRPAVYEIRPGESLRDLIGFAGGFGPSAYQARVRIHRILPPDSRGPGGGARVVLDVGGDQTAGGVVPAVPVAPGDSVTVLAIPDQVRGYVSVKGNVWVEGRVGFAPGMKLSEALRVAGGPKPDVYLDRVLISRTNDDSSRVQLRSAFADSTGRLTEDLALQDQDEIQVFSRAAFLPAPYVTIVGGVNNPGRVPFRQGMTMRDVVLLAQGVTEDADLTEAEIARRTDSNDPGALATSITVPLDSAQLTPGGSSSAAGPSVNRSARGVPDVALMPYDNVLIRRKAGWESQRLVYLTGQVKHPGRYALRSKTERISDLMARAGGLTPQAYAGGIQFYRSYAPGHRPSNERPAAISEEIPGKRDTLPRGFTERLGIDLPKAMKSRKAGDNVILAGGDSIHIPEFNPVVIVDGAVNSPGPVVYTAGKSLDWYVDAAGGYTQLGDNRRAYVTQPNGKRESVKRRAILADAVPRPKSGAQVFVPTRRIQEQPSNLAGILSVAAQVLAAVVTIVVVTR
ncbi:MAG: SLBB domain-containing protein [Gemmatimonadales bacterium]|nr:SLBB domain-containing protein [Gemmatimonadales bacterium]